MSEKKTHTFTCEGCGGTFESEWSEDEARAEQVEVFGFTLPKQECCLLCDDCYAAFMRSFNRAAANQ